LWFLGFVSVLVSVRRISTSGEGLSMDTTSVDRPVVVAELRRAAIGIYGLGQ